MRKKNYVNPNVKWSGFTLSRLAQEEIITWLYSHWTFVIREIETWWNIATRSMSLVFKINILALTWRLFSMNASASIWHFSSSRRLLSCDNTQFHWHYLLSTWQCSKHCMELIFVKQYHENIKQRYQEQKWPNFPALSYVFDTQFLGECCVQVWATSGSTSWVWLWGFKEVNAY